MAYCHFRVPKMVRIPLGLRRLFFLLIAAGLTGGAVVAMSLRVAAEGPQPESIPSLDRSASGSLVICGGGRLPEAVPQRFLELAGGSEARIVLIPTAETDSGVRVAAENADRWRQRGAASVHLLHTRSRAEANDPAFLRPLTEATGVWFGGGNQSRLSESYVDTAVEFQLKALLDRGGVIGGTSAGAAIMTRVMITGGRTKATEGRGFDLLPGAVVDQHFLKRNRLERLRGLLADHPDLVGFGIDEGTALVFRGDRLSVLGDSHVVACWPAASERAAQLEILKPGDHPMPPWLHASRAAGKSDARVVSRTETPELAASTQ
jgi:cyanophycinase